MHLQILNENVTGWERVFAFWPRLIPSLVKRPGADRSATYDVVTSVIWLRYYYRRVEVSSMTNTWAWKYSATLPEA